MTTKAEAQATIADLERQKAEAERGLAAIRAAEVQAAAQAEQKIRLEEAELARIHELVSSVARAAAIWKELQDLAGDKADDPQLLKGLLCLAIGDPVNVKDQWRGYVQGWQLGINPGDPSPLDVPGFRELQAAHVQRDEAERARVKAHNAPRGR
jgi:hypothetical protein